MTVPGDPPTGPGGRQGRGSPQRGDATKGAPATPPAQRKPRPPADPETSEDATGQSSDQATEESVEEELTRLRAQVADLQADQARPAPTSDRPRTGSWRPWVAGALISVAALLAPASVLAAWAHDQVADTDRYVETITPLGSDPAVQRAIVDRITTELFARLDVEAVTEEAVDALAAQGLPERVTATLSALSTPLANGIRSFVTERVTRIVESPEFEQAWVAANRAAHEQMLALLTGQGTEQVSVAGDSVQINLAAVIEVVKQRLEQAGFGLASRIPQVNAQFTVFESADLTKAQTGFRLLDAAARGLPVLALLLLVLAVYLARDRRRALMASGLAVAASMLLLGAMLNAFRPVYLNAIDPAELPRDAAATIYDTLVQYIRLNLRAVLVVALAVAAGAWLAGRSSAATATRRGLSGFARAVRGGAGHAGLNTGPVGAFAYTYRTTVRALVVGVAVVTYVLAEHPTGLWTLKVLGITVVMLVLVEIIARPPDSTAPEPAATPVPASPV